MSEASLFRHCERSEAVQGHANDSGLRRFARNDSYTANRAAFSSSGSASPFARYDTVR
jgi:hypothetical protein